MEHFDFKKKKAVNPLEKVDNFFINPLMMQSAVTLSLEHNVKQDEVRTIAFYKGMPVVIFPLSILKLKTCVIEWKDNGGIIISKSDHGQTDIYFKWTDEEDTIRIDTVLVKGMVSNRELQQLLNHIDQLIAL